MHKLATPDTQPCIDLCQECHDICVQTIAYCLDHASDRDSADLVRLLTDCAEICQTSANFMLRESGLHTATCQACATVCGACADACARLNGDKTMERCAEACRECAESCSQMARR